MEKRDNYALASAQARKLFAGYDPRELARKLGTRLDDSHLYTALFGEEYRIALGTGDVSRFHDGQWIEANSFSQVLTLLDLVCDSREDRHPAGRWKNMASFGMQFHDNLLEGRDPWADRLEANPEAFARACRAMGGRPFPHGDAAYILPVFDSLELVVQLWFGDEDFPAQLRYLWDENAKQYIKYETMHYSIGLLKTRLEEEMA